MIYNISCPGSIKHLIGFFAVTAFILSANGCSRKKALDIPEANITIDGDLRDWNLVPYLSSDNDPILTKISADEKYVYAWIKFNDRRFYQDAMKFGLTIALDRKKKLRNSFAVTYPTGLINELSQYPGARAGFVRDPMWVQDPMNKPLLEGIDERMYDFAMLSFRQEKSDPERFVRLSLAELEASGVLVKTDLSGQALAMELRFPINSSNAEPFAIDPEEKNTAYFTVSIRPPSMTEILQEEQRALDPNMRGFDRVGRNAAGPNERGVVRGMDQQIQDQVISMQMMGAYEDRKLIRLD
jgi:hypothetical protein